MIFVDTRRYLTIPFAHGGRDQRGADCWGLYRLVVGEATGIWLDEHGGLSGYPAYSRRLVGERSAGDWSEVAAGDERICDLVLMTGYLRSEGRTHAAPLHVGCVLEPGLMIDTEEGSGVMVRAYRATLRRQALPTVTPRVLGIWRHRAVAHLVEESA